jgi:phage shock protein PspC (stress-responsive transcriptional regulator)
MKKTFTINISGIIFHIDEDAYEKLSIYLETIKGYFTNSEGKEEIVADIESRIAEILQGKITESKQVINIEDIGEVIKIMGEPEQIGAANGADTHQAKTAEKKARRRLYRDPDSKVLGGVCGGIGAYFNIDPVWIRVAFVVALFLFGSGPLLYIILWIIIPEAVTTAEKLEMRGEPVNISNIEKSIHEEIDGLKKRLNNLKNDAKSAYSRNFRNQQPQTAAEKVVDFALTLGKYFIRAVAIFVGIIFIMVGIFLMIGFISSFFRANDVIWISSMGISNFSFPVFLKLFLGSSEMITLALIGLALFIGIPLLMLVYNGIKMIFGYKSKKRFIGISSFTLWFAGLILCIIVGLGILSSFSHKSGITKKAELIQPKNNLLKVYIKKDDMVDSLAEYESKFVIGQWNLVATNDKSIRFGLPELKIVSSENENYQLVVYYTSKGTDKEDANDRIRNIEYKFNQNDTALVLDPYYILPQDEKWRSQNIKVVIKVPLWKGIYLSPETASILHYDSDNFESSKDLSGKQWVMTENGLKEFTSSNVYMTQDTLKKPKADTLKKIK